MNAKERGNAPDPLMKAKTKKKAQSQEICEGQMRIEDVAAIQKERDSSGPNVFS